MRNLPLLVLNVREAFLTARKEVRLFAVMKAYGVSDITADLYDNIANAFVARHGHIHSDAECNALIDIEIKTAEKKFGPVELFVFLIAIRRLLDCTEAKNAVPISKKPLERSQSDPPHVAEFLIGLLANKRHRAGLLACLEEDFRADLAAGMSLSRAKRRYWAAALNSIGPQLWAAIKRLGLIGAAFDYIRGKLG